MRWISFIMQERTIKDYVFQEQISHGGYAAVFKCTDTHTNQTVALKKMIAGIGLMGIAPFALRQMSILREVEHPNIVKLLGFICDQHLYLVFEHMTCDLRGYMNQSPLNEIQIKRFLHQILSGIAYCHSKKVFHRDLKPHNILIGEDGNIKIADFGLARTFSVPEKAYSLGVVTQFYRPPEILLGSAFYGPQIDIWSIGCIFAEMSTNRPLFQGDSEADQLSRIFMLLGTPTTQSWAGVQTLPGYQANFAVHPKRLITNTSGTFEGALNLSDSGLDLLNRMLCLNPKERISAKEALHHQYFNTTIE